MKKGKGILSSKGFIAFILAVSISFVCIAGHIIVQQSRSSGGSDAVTNADPVAATVGYDKLRSVSDLTLADNDTQMGKIGEALTSGYEKLVFECSDGKSLSSGKEEFIELLSRLKEQALAALDSDEDGTELSGYRGDVVSGFEELEKHVSQLNEDNSEEILEKIRDTISSENTNSKTASELPFNNVSSGKIGRAKYSLKKTVSYQIADKDYSDSDLQQTNDTRIDDNVRNEFSDKESVLDVYQYIKNNYTMEFYYGSRKGAVGASAEKAGNDYDIASTLIGVLRDRNIPARYAKGMIEITAEQAMDWTATSDINSAMRTIAALGIPTTALTSKGKTVAVQIEHVWVEAYVPYTDYRGTGNKSGKSLWIPLDASFKKSVHEDGVKLSDIKDYLEDSSNQITSSTELHGVNIGNLADYDNSALIKYMLENGYGESTLAEAFGGKTIVTEDLGYLPLSLPYQNADKAESFDDISDKDTDSVTIRLYGNSADGNDFSGSNSLDYTYQAPDVYGKRIVLSYVPATQADQDVIGEYGNLFKAPAYMVKLKPQLSIDGEVVAEGSVCNAGYSHKYTITVHNGAPSENDSDITNTVTAGGMYCIAMDYGNISGTVLEDSAEYLNSLKDSTTTENIYSEKVMGGLLDSVSKLYFGQLDLYNRVLAGQTAVTQARALSLGIVGFKANVTYAFSRPAELNEGGIFLDIGHDVHSVVSITGEKKNEKSFMLQAGIYASAMEHGVLEQTTGIESVSTIKTFQYAKEHDIPLHTIVKDNLSDELNAITVSDQVKKDIRSAVNAGRIVIIPEKEITINQWSGIGYMVLDPDTYACGYMISSGMAGGSMTAGEMISEYVDYVIEGAVSAIVWEVCKTILLAISPCGWVATISFLINAAEFIMLISYVEQIIDLVQMYQQTGEIRYLQELSIRIAAMGTLGIASKIFGSRITKLKEEINNVIDEAGLKGKCFVAGTLVLAVSGLIPIENVRAGDKVYSFNADTQEVSKKTVEETFVRESNELVHITVNGETISSTPDHPFYVPQKGFVRAINLRAGDVLWTVNGEYVVVEKVQHEILESPVKVFNFRVADNHTYFVGNNAVGVHNNNSCVVNRTVKPEAAVEGSKKHGVNWKEGSARAIATGKPQGQWALEDLNFATEKANTLKPHESGTFDLPEGSKSIVHMPDGTIKHATKFWIRNNGTGTWHGYPME